MAIRKLYLFTPRTIFTDSQCTQTQKVVHTINKYRVNINDRKKNMHGEQEKQQKLKPDAVLQQGEIKTFYKVQNKQ